MFLLFPVRLLVLFVDTSLAVVLLLCFSVSRFFFLFLLFLLLCFYAFLFIRVNYCSASLPFSILRSPSAQN